jgi:alpha-tubulin suppressor-like RCC1 family protein
MMLTRREALALLPATPAALRAMAQAPLPVARIRRIVEGRAFYVIEPDGRVKVWTIINGVKRLFLGLGDDGTVPPYVAQEAPALRGATTIACGEQADYAAMSDGRVLAWGINANGLLGNTPLAELEVTAQPHPPVAMPTETLPMPKVVDVKSAGRHVLALTAEGTVFAWGNGQSGQLGIGDMPVINFKTHVPAPMAYVPFPVRVAALSGVTASAAGFMHSLALLEDGSVWAWGENQFGQIGDGTVVNRASPVPVRGVNKAIAVAAGAQYSLALLSNGTVMGWGWGNGALGGRPGMSRHGANPVPQLVPGATGIIAIAAGGQHALGLTASGTVLSWGDENVYHPVAHSARIPLTTPAPVPQITNARGINAGSLSSQAVLADGTILFWGAPPSLAYRVDGGDGRYFPIPLVVKGL